MKCRHRKKKSIKTCRLLNQAQSSYSLWVLTWMDPASSFSLFYPCRSNLQRIPWKKCECITLFFVSILYKIIKLLKSANVDCYGKKNKNNEYWCSVVFHRNALLIVIFKLQSVWKHLLCPGAESKHLTVNFGSQKSYIFRVFVKTEQLEREQIVISHITLIRLVFIFFAIIMTTCCKRQECSSIFLTFKMLALQMSKSLKWKIESNR